MHLSKLVKAHIENTLGSTSIRHRSNTRAFDRCQIDVDWRISAVWVSHDYCWLTLQWRHNGHDSVSNHQPYDCLLNRLFRRRSKKTSKLRVTGLCAGNSPGTGEFPAQMTSNAENVSIWWRHQESLAKPVKTRNLLMAPWCHTPGHHEPGFDLLSNLLYKAHKTPKLKCFLVSSCSCL